MCVSRSKAKGFTREERKGSGGEGSLIQSIIEKLTWKLKYGKIGTSGGKEAVLR